jgi:hypothetical protein
MIVRPRKRPSRRIRARGMRRASAPCAGAPFRLQFCPDPGKSRQKGPEAVKEVGRSVTEGMSELYDLPRFRTTTEPHPIHTGACARSPSASRASAVLPSPATGSLGRAQRIPRTATSAAVSSMRCAFRASCRCGSTMRGRELRTAGRYCVPAYTAAPIGARISMESMRCSDEGARLPSMPAATQIQERIHPNSSLSSTPN